MAHRPLSLTAPANAPGTTAGARLRTRAAALLLTLLALIGSAWAQRPQQADALLQQAREAEASARSSPIQRTPDQADWRRAIELGGQALSLAPHDLELERFMARTYSYVKWYARAYTAWLAYLADGGELSADAPHPEGEQGDPEMFAEAGTQLGFARYQAGDAEGALRYYGKVHDLLPDDAEALRWLGRIHFEQGEADQALPFWQRLVELQPDDAGAKYYLERTKQRLAVGAEASDLYQKGIGSYEAGDLQAAQGQFEAALKANADFTDAAVWAGRTSLELGQPRKAQGYWRQVTLARPDDGRARYFLEVATTEVTWGVDAGKAYYDGQAKYQAGDVEGARADFAKALAANPAFVDAWVWAARTSQESGHFADAILYWQGVVQRSPDDSRASYFLQQAKTQLDYGPEAGAAFIAGVEKYQAGQFDEAETDLKKAVADNPSFPEAWGTLGRMYFQQARYHEAADAFQRALELRPANDDYAFFAKEATRLAGP